MNISKKMGLMILVSAITVRASDNLIQTKFVVKPIAVEWVYQGEKTHEGKDVVLNVKYSKEDLIKNLQDIRIDKYNLVSIKDKEGKIVPDIKTLQDLADKLSADTYKNFENKYPKLKIVLQKKGWIPYGKIGAAACVGAACYAAYKNPEATQSWLTSMWDKVSNFFSR